ncbi:MAG: HAMP domain-containing sensor histidine kinase, partial [Cyanobacteriota bacterium]|nr:HAMP domain-containing sensor histidine kinase [Cyanobacteriota bacterium]
MASRDGAETGGRWRGRLPLALGYGAAALAAAGLTLLLLQLLLGRRLAEAREDALSAQIASSLLLGQVALERFSPEGLAEVAGLRLAVGPDPGPQGTGPLRAADEALLGQARSLHQRLCRRLGHCPEIRPALRGGRGVWVAMASPLEQVWLFAPLPRLRGWPPDPLPLALGVGIGGLTATLLFLSLEVQRPLRQLEQALGDVELESRPAAVPLRGAGAVRRLAQRFNAMLERLEAADRERRTMLAGIAHDLRAPLTRLRLRLDEAGGEREAGGEASGDGDSRGGDSSGDDRAGAARARTEADLAALERITGQFLLFAGAGGDEQPVLVPLQGVLAELAAVADADTLQLDLVQLERWVRPVALGRAIANLIDNALAHGRPPIRLSLRAGPGPDGFTIRVHDAGEGIPPDRWRRALEPFQRLDRARGAPGHCGLGLAIAERVAREHGGRLWAEAGGAEGGFAVCFEGCGT